MRIWTQVGALNSSNFELKQTKIYPNPTNGILNIETSKSIEKIEILNLQGSIISTFGNERILDLSSYDDGIYLIRTITDEGIELKRVEVIH